MRPAPTRQIPTCRPGRPPYCWGQRPLSSPPRAAMLVVSRSVPVRPGRLLAVYYLLPPPLRTSVLVLVLLLSTAGLALTG